MSDPLIPIGTNTRLPAENNASQPSPRVHEVDQSQPVGEGDTSPRIERRQGDRRRNARDRRLLTPGEPRTDRRRNSDRRSPRGSRSDRKGQQGTNSVENKAYSRKGRIIDEQV